MDVRLLEKENMQPDLELYNVWYESVPELFFDSILGFYHTYGIQSSTDLAVETLHDVSSSVDVVCWMVELFNKHRLSPVHLRDAVMDMLP